MKIFVLSMFFVLLSGCASHQAASNLITAEQVSLANYQKNIALIFEGMISGYRTLAQADADAKYNAAIKSETKPDGSANAKTILVLGQWHLEDYAKIEKVILDMRAKFAVANQDAANAMNASNTLKAVMDQSSSTANLMSQSSTTALALLQQYIESTKAK